MPPHVRAMKVSIPLPNYSSLSHLLRYYLRIETLLYNIRFVSHFFFFHISVVSLSSSTRMYMDVTLLRKAWIPRRNKRWESKKNWDTPRKSDIKFKDFSTKVKIPMLTLIMGQKYYNVIQWLDCFCHDLSIAQSSSFRESSHILVGSRKRKSI